MRNIEELQSLTKCFKRVAVNRDSVTAWLKLSQTKMQDAHNASVSETTRLEACYDAAFNVAQCVLMAKGFRISAEAGHHVYTWEGACAEIGAPQTLWDMLDALRELRNHKYAGIPSSREDMDQSLHVTAEFISAALSWLQRHHPRLLKPA